MGLVIDVLYRYPRHLSKPCIDSYIRSFSSITFSARPMWEKPLSPLLVYRSLVLHCLEQWQVIIVWKALVLLLRHLSGRAVSSVARVKFGVLEARFVPHVGLEIWVASMEGRLPKGDLEAPGPHRQALRALCKQSLMVQHCLILLEDRRTMRETHCPAQYASHRINPYRGSGRLP